MAYDPFARGPYPVGVRTLSLTDAARDARALPTEVWYPATDASAGQDLDPATRDAYELVPGFPPFPQDAVRDAAPRAGRRPVVLFSHGYGGHRRQSTFLCTHLASHGYVVAAVDHTGNTMLDVVRQMLRAQAGEPSPGVDAQLGAFARGRPADVSFTLDALLAGELAELLDAGRVGMTGHSFGGWTAIATTARDRRIRAAVPLAPAGGWTPITAALRCRDADFAWGRAVPTLFVVADRDTLLPLRGTRELFERAPGPKRLVVLRNADHMHFCDRPDEVHEMFRSMPQDPIFEPLRARIPPFAELCPGEHALDAIRALALAHFDAHVAGDDAARAFAGGDVAAALAARGIAADVIDPGGAPPAQRT
jgi:predicted dienelactone hydrolase